MAESNAMPEGCDAIITPEEEHLYSEKDRAELEELAELMSAGEPGRLERTKLDPMWYMEQLNRIEADVQKVLGLSTQLLGKVNVLLEQVNAISGADSEDD